MKAYLVGGAVRDELLGLEVKDRDWVVVGATEAELMKQGYTRVGSEFPVFLHPDTHEEYALARTERKIAPGHTGFECRADADVTLEEDLRRRDLTINAIARDERGNIVDPYKGQQDLESRILRHVSDAFIEDPLRILRVARFKAAFHHLGFEVHPETLVLLKNMIAENMHAELTPERMLLELNKALETNAPVEFFRLLQRIEANESLWPEVSADAIRKLAEANATDPESRFCILLLAQPQETISELCQRLKTPRLRLELASLVTSELGEWQRFGELHAQDKVSLVLRADGIRKVERFHRLNEICEDISGQMFAGAWREVRDTMASVKASDLDLTHVSGEAIGQEIRKEQINRVGLLA